MIFLRLSSKPCHRCGYKKIRVTYNAVIVHIRRSCQLNGNSYTQKGDLLNLLTFGI